MNMKICAYTLLLLDTLLWIAHWSVGFLYDASFCHRGDHICSLSFIKVLCELVGMVLSLLILHLGTLKFKALVLTMAFMLSFATDVYICIANLNREDDDSPRSMIIYPCGFTLEENRHAAR